LIPRIWHALEPDSELKKSLAHALEIHPVTAAVLIGRGVTTVTQARRFLNPSSDILEDPSALPDILPAVARIRKALMEKHPVAVYGDYDVDGMTATALYLEWFQRRAHPAMFYIPDRLKEGYGLHQGAIRSLCDQGVRLMITADCGTTSISEIRYARSLGMDVIVTDHHESAPDSDADTFEWSVINPKRRSSRYGFDGLCTAGLAYKVIGMLDEQCGVSAGPFDGGLDLVALGTVADVSPMTGENRFLVSRGLRTMTEGNRPGIRALKASAGINGKSVGCGTVGFVLAPRINAIGRLSDAREGVRLLTTDSMEEAGRISLDLERWNRERQRMEQEIVEEADEVIRRDVNLDEEACIVLASQSWHLGVVGIGASRLAERYGRPCVLISIDGMDTGRGSARSVPGYPIHQGLAACSDLLSAYGGHRQAAGLTVRKENIPHLRSRLSEHVRSSLGRVRSEAVLKLDATVSLEDLDFRLVSELERLRPHGIGNPEPTLAVRDAVGIEPRIVGNNHLKMKIRQRGAVTYDAIGFRMGGELDRVRKAGRLAVAFIPEVNTWQGEDRIQLRLKDIQTDG
jgi:single-stranded-DNA-specific exonuclease